jgi:hypothetical protein
LQEKSTRAESHDPREIKPTYHGYHEKGRTQTGVQTNQSEACGSSRSAPEAARHHDIARDSRARYEVSHLRAAAPGNSREARKGSLIARSDAAMLPEVDSVVVSSCRPGLLDRADFAAVVEKRLESDETVIDALASSPQLPRDAPYML